MRACRSHNRGSHTAEILLAVTNKSLPEATLFADLAVSTHHNGKVSITVKCYH